MNNPGAMKQVPTILLAEDDEGHAFLVQQNLKRGGLSNPVKLFTDGQAILDFLFSRGPGPKRDAGGHYLLLLDIRMPKVDGVEVLRQIKADTEMRAMPVIMLTTTDDPREVRRCHELGCNSYIQKPVDYDKFAEAIQRLGMFVTLLIVPPVSGAN